MPNILRLTGISGRRVWRFGIRLGYLRNMTRMQMTAEMACEPTVATATPATPMLSPMTLMRSRITFKMEHRMRKYSGVLLSPSARRIDAAALYANCAMPQPQTI